MSKAYEALDRQREALMLMRLLEAKSATQGRTLNKDFAKGQAGLLEAADAFFWRENAVARVQSTESSFNMNESQLTREQLYRDVMFWWFEKPRFSIAADNGIESENIERVDVCALLVAWVETRHGIGLMMNPYYTPRRSVPTTTATSLFLPVGHTWGMMRESVQEHQRLDVNADEVLNIARFVLAGNVFIRQRLLETRAAGISPALRGKLKHEGLWDESEALLVSLRAVDYNRTEGLGGGVEREFQWWTRGHPRQQWYPSLDQHLTIWIDAHLNGPAGTPIKPRQTPVFNICR